MVKEGAGATTLTIEGFNFVRRSRAYVDGVVKNAEPVANPQWGHGESNAAHLILGCTY